MIIPLGNRVVAQKVENEGEIKTNSGLIVGKENKGKTRIIKLINKSECVSEDEEIINNKINIGDKLVIDQYTGVEIKENENEYILIRLVDILGIIK